MESEVMVMGGVLKLIEKQVSMWDFKNRRETVVARQGRCQVGGVAYGPCLLLSRQCGSGGVLVARLAAQRLGWNLFDRELVDQTAKLAHVRRRLIESVDERVRSYWEDAWREVLEPETLGGEKFLQCLRQVILTLGHHGDVVIVGRGAHHVLPSQCALRVRVVAPLERRAECVAEREGLVIKDARLIVRKLDADRSAFIRKNFKADTDDAANYDLVINTGETGIEAATEIVLVALREKLGVGVTR